MKTSSITLLVIWCFAGITAINTALKVRNNESYRNFLLEKKKLDEYGGIKGIIYRFKSKEGFFNYYFMTNCSSAIFYFALGITWALTSNTKQNFFLIACSLIILLLFVICDYIFYKLNKDK